MRKTAMDVAGTAIGVGLVLLLAHGTPANGQGGAAPAPRVADAKPGDVRVMTTGAIRTPLDAVRAEAEKAIGHPLVIEYGSARGNIKDGIQLELNRNASRKQP